MIPLIEENVGIDSQAIQYPGVSSCCTVTIVLADGTLIGVHLTIGTPKDRLEALLAKMAELCRDSGQTPRTLIIAGVRSQWSGAPPTDSGYTMDSVQAKLESELHHTFAANSVVTADSGTVSHDSMVRVDKRPDGRIELKVDPMSRFRVAKDHETIGQSTDAKIGRFTMHGKYVAGGAAEHTHHRSVLTKLASAMHHRIRVRHS